MTIQQIKYIIAVKELHHFGLAAAKCFVTQSTLSTMVGRFEQEIGIQIFDRKTKPISITKEGKKIIAQLQIILKEVENLDEEVKALKGELKGELKIGVIPTVAPYILPRFLSHFTQKYPQIYFSISELTTDMIVRQLKNRELDLGILAIPLLDADLVEYPLYQEDFVLYDSSGQRPYPFIDLEHINYAKFWLLEEEHCFGTQVIKICDLKNKNPSNEMNFDFKAGSIDSLIRFVKANNGLTFLPYLASLDLNETEQQKIRRFKKDIPVRTIGLLTHQHFVKKQILSLLEQEIKNTILPLLPKNSKPKKNITPLF